MGSTYQYLIGLNALKQLRIPIRHTDNPALNVFHLQKIRDGFAKAEETPETYFMAKTHPAFPEQAEAVLSAEHARVFLVWRDQEDALVSDFHFAQRHAGHIYRDFDDYFARRGRKILLRNCLQKVTWDAIDDLRVRAWDYLDLVHEFDRSAAEMLDFAGLEGVDLTALKDSVSIEQLRKTRNDPTGTFFRKGGKQDLTALNPSPQVLAEIEAITSETDGAKLAAGFEREDWLRVLLFGRECREAGPRKLLHWWLQQPHRAKYLRETLLPKFYRLSPRRFIGAIRSR